MVQPNNAGGTTQQQTGEAEGLTLSPNEFTTLQSRLARTSASNPGHSQNLAIMLLGRGRWSVEQVADFIGAAPSQVQQWLGDYRERGLASMPQTP